VVATSLSQKSFCCVSSKVSTVRLGKPRAKSTSSTCATMVAGGDDDVVIWFDGEDSGLVSSLLDAETVKV